MRKRGKIFKNFQDVKKTEDPVVNAIAALCENLKLVLEVLCDLRVNTSDDPKVGEGEPRKEKKGNEGN
jgi:hypothetical protein